LIEYPEIIAFQETESLCAMQSKTVLDAPIRPALAYMSRRAVCTPTLPPCPARRTLPCASLPSQRHPTAVQALMTGANVKPSEPQRAHALRYRPRSSWWNPWAEKHRTARFSEYTVGRRWCAEANTAAAETGLPADR
jgi:hypothetical protein